MLRFWWWVASVGVACSAIFCNDILQHFATDNKDHGAGKFATIASYTRILRDTHFARAVAEVFRGGVT